MTKKITVGSSKIYSVSSNPSGSLISSKGDLALSTEGYFYINQGGALWDLFQTGSDVPSVWSDTSNGQTGIDNAISSSGGQIKDGDVIFTGNSSFEYYSQNSPTGSHAVPLGIGRFDRSDVHAFKSVDPVNAGIGGFSYGGSGSPTYSIIDDRLHLSASNSSDIARINLIAPNVIKPYIMVLEDLDCVGANNSVQFNIWSDVGNDRYIIIINDSGAWKIRTTNGSYINTGQSTTSRSTLEILFDADSLYCRYRFGRSGEWTNLDVFSAAFSTTLLWRVFASHSGATPAAVAFKSMFLAPIQL